MINSRDINDLTPQMQTFCQQFIDNCAAAGIKVILTSTYRDFESQSALYAQGRTTAGKVVTNAKAGQSWHNYRIAFDFAPLQANGTIDWNNTALFTQCAQIGKALGLEWGGDWATFKDIPHLQLAGQSLSALQAQYPQGGGDEDY